VLRCFGQGAQAPRGKIFPAMRKRRSAVLLYLVLALAVLCQSAAAGDPPALASPLARVRQGFGPSGLALTRDGLYAYLSFDLSSCVFKVRLSDMTVVASADFSRYFPLESSTIALDSAEAKVFLWDHTFGRVLVLDAATLQEIRMIAGFPTGSAQLVTSRWGPYVILGNWLIDTGTLAVTKVSLSRGFNFVRESATDPTLWYTASSQTGSTDIGIYNNKTGQWSAKATINWSPPFSVNDFAVLPDGSKAYIAVLGPWYPDLHASGWVYSIDLQKGTVKQVPVDGGAGCLAVSSDGRRVYVGAGWPLPASNVIQVLDTRTDAPVNVFQIAPQKFGWNSTQINELGLDPVSGQWLYATSNDGNDLLKIDAATGAVAAVLVMNEESNPPTSFVREPGTSRGYVLLSRTNEAVEIDLNSARATRVVQLPLIRNDFQGFGAAFRDANTLLVAQGEYFMELAADLTLRAKHNLPPGAPSIWGVLASRDAKTLYSVSASPSSAGANDTFLAIDATSFQIKASLHLDGGVFNLPWEHPDAGKLYVLGGMQNGAALVQVIDAQSFALRKTIGFDDASAPGISAGPYYPYTYDPSSRTLFVGATWAVLAIDTDRDEIKRVIRLDQITAGMGIQPNDFTVLNAVGLAFDPSKNRLNIAHLDGSFVSVYDLAKNQFLSQLIPLKGYFPDRLLANDDSSNLLTLNMRSDDISVIDTKAATVTQLIDICNPLPGGGGRQPRKHSGLGCPSSAGSY